MAPEKTAEKKTLDTLVEDIYRVVSEGTEIPEEALDVFSTRLQDCVRSRLSPRGREEVYLRLSNLGTNCDRKLWLSVRHPEVVEELSPDTRMKFLIGDLLECFLLFLSELSGHTVEGEQTEVNIRGVKGHRDAVIDGTVVDVKSASSRSFFKFKEGLKPETDSFGYITQLGSYLHCAEDDPVVTDKTKAAFLVIDKTLGKLLLDVHEKPDLDFEKLSEEKQQMLKQDDIPDRAFSDIPDGKSGNRKLGMECSYCPVKKRCWGRLRGFAYSNGPRYLTKVGKEPEVPEFTVE